MLWRESQPRNQPPGPLEYVLIFMTAVDVHITISEGVKASGCQNTSFLNVANAASAEALGRSPAGRHPHKTH